MYQNILFTIDLNALETQRKALETAITLTKVYSSNLHVMTVFPDFGMSVVGTYFPKDFEKKALTTAEEKLHSFVAKNVPDDLNAKHYVGHGTIYKEILGYADKKDINLIVMASHRPELKDYLLGPNAARVVRHAECSVMVVRE